MCFLHGQLAPLAWAFQRAAPGARLGYVQTAGGALPGGLSEVVRLLRELGLLAGHVTAGPAYGGRAERSPPRARCSTGSRPSTGTPRRPRRAPASSGRARRSGTAGWWLDSAHTAAALGCRVVVAPRRSAADPRPRHRGLSHHTRTMLELALVPFVVATPDGQPEPGLGRHEWRRGAAELDAYAASGLPARTMGRTLAEDPDLFAAALAAGNVLAAAAREVP